ncbi:MAG TPA: alpha/beta hydrolase, partial [Tahibacter sp.]|nr:alpha/beta hydrolase [Tahibacter sp.]
MKGHVILSHGSDSGPDATKVSALAAVAERCGWRTSRPDYRDLDARGTTACVAPRVA